MKEINLLIFAHTLAEFKAKAPLTKAFLSQDPAISIKFEFNSFVKHFFESLTAY